MMDRLLKAFERSAVAYVYCFFHFDFQEGLEIGNLECHGDKMCYRVMVGHQIAYIQEDQIDFYLELIKVLKDGEDFFQIVQDLTESPLFPRHYYVFWSICHVQKWNEISKILARGVVRGLDLNTVCTFGGFGRTLIQDAILKQHSDALVILLEAGGVIDVDTLIQKGYNQACIDFAKSFDIPETKGALLEKLKEN